MPWSQAIFHKKGKKAPKSKSGPVSATNPRAPTHTNCAFQYKTWLLKRPLMVLVNTKKLEPKRTHGAELVAASGCHAAFQKDEKLQLGLKTRRVSATNSRGPKQNNQSF